MEKAEIRPKLGRPSKYEPWMCESVITAGQEGGHIYDMCKAIGVASFTTFYKWQDEYPEFKEAVAIAKQESICWWLQVNKGIALGEINGKHQAVMAILKNKDVEHFNAEQHTTKNININHNNVISEDQYKKLLEEAKNLTKKLENGH